GCSWTGSPPTSWPGKGTRRTRRSGSGSRATSRRTRRTRLSGSARKRPARTGSSTAGSPGIDTLDRLALPADARVFLGRLTHLDPGALVRLRPAGEGRTALWARLPWRVLVTREVVGSPPADATFIAADLLAAGAEPEP